MSIIKFKKKFLHIISCVFIFISPRLFNLLYYLFRVKKTCHLNPPRTFSEKTIWLKLYWRDPLAVICADKYLVRNYIEEKGYGHILIPLLGVYEKAEDIDVNTLPEQFVLKATHASYWNLLCKDKSKYDWNEEKYKMRSWFKDNYYYRYGEWNYKEMTPRIVCEQYMQEADRNDLTDYKIMCFNGKPEFIMVYVERFGDKAQCGMFDLDWNLMPSASFKFTKLDHDLPRPTKLDSMIEIAKDLSQPFPFVRVDLYEVNAEIYFGELTFYHSAGFSPFRPEEYDLKYGNLLDLTGVNNE